MSFNEKVKLSAFSDGWYIFSSALGLSKLQWPQTNCFVWLPQGSSQVYTMESSVSPSFRVFFSFSRLLLWGDVFQFQCDFRTPYFCISSGYLLAPYWQKGKFVDWQRFIKRLLVFPHYDFSHTALFLNFHFASWRTFINVSFFHSMCVTLAKIPTGF